MDNADRIASIVESLPEEIQCQIFSNVTQLKDVTKLIRVSRAFNSIGKDCITIIESTKQISVPVEFLIKFPRLRRLNNIIVSLNTEEEAAQIGQLKDIQKAIFVLPDDDILAQEIMDTYVNTVCSHNEQSLLGKQLSFVILRQGQLPAIVSLNGVNIWQHDIIPAHFNSNIIQTLDPKSILNCTGLRQIEISADIFDNNRDAYQKSVGTDVQLIKYVIPIRLIKLNDAALNLLHRFNYKIDLQSQLNVFRNRVVDWQTAKYLLLTGLMLDGSVWNFDYIKLPPELLAIAETKNARRRSPYSSIDKYVIQKDLFALFEGLLNDYHDDIDFLIKSLSPSLSLHMMDMANDDTVIVNNYANQYIDVLKAEIRADPARQEPGRTTHITETLPGTVSLRLGQSFISDNLNRYLISSY